MRSLRLAYALCAALPLCWAASLVGLAGCTPACPSTRLACSDLCIDPQSDVANCGACGNKCGAGQLCTAGHCSVPCGAGLAVCGTACADLQRDANHCGDCATACASGQKCSAGMCVSGCPAPLSACGTSCTNLNTDAANCGTCGMACPGGQACVAGQCTAECPPSFTLCSAGCANLSSDPSHCGACSQVCPAGNLCVNGACAASCPSTLMACGGTCVDPMKDAKNCGTCGNACPSGNVCKAMNGTPTCVPVCQMGYTGCNGTCTNTLTDPSNCGGCNTKCAAGQVCSNGQCASTCIAPLVTCGTGSSVTCADIVHDPANCGGCAKACADISGAHGTAGCLNSSCVVASCSAPYADCDGTYANGCEANTNTDPKNCGGCGNFCPTTANVATSACDGSGHCKAASCNPGYLDCDSTWQNGCEINGNTDPKNCGGCNKPCPTGQGCSNGFCSFLIGDTLLPNAAASAQINTWIGPPGQVWTLCYHSSLDGLATSTFHAKCDGRGPTVVIASLNAGTGNARIVGGYASQAWTSNCSWFGDSNSFLFSITNMSKQVYPGVNGSGNWLFGCSTTGPVFGAGYDFYTGVTSIGNSVTCNVGYTYQCRSGSSYPCSVDFCGANPPTVTDLEVFVKQGA